VGSGGNDDDEEQQSKKEQYLHSDHLLTLPFPLDRFTSSCSAPRPA
jgi:hypothetical protein